MTIGWCVNWIDYDITIGDLNALQRPENNYLFRVSKHHGNRSVCNV